jgi:hypothetical protein
MAVPFVDCGAIVWVWVGRRGRGWGRRQGSNGVENGFENDNGLQNPKTL